MQIRLQPRHVGRLGEQRLAAERGGQVRLEGVATILHVRRPRAQAEAPGLAVMVHGQALGGEAIAVVSRAAGHATENQVQLAFDQGGAIEDDRAGDALRWRTLGEGDIGLEHLELKISDTGIAAEAVVIAGSGETAHGARWRITLDPDWACARSLHLTRLGGATVALRHDGYGEWSDGEGKKRKDFQGLADCLIEGSPFGVGALLKRLGAKAAKSQTVDVVTVSLPRLEIARTAVTLDPLEPGRRWRLTRSGTATEFAVDADGFVTAWGDRVTRVEDPVAAL